MKTYSRLLLAFLFLILIVPQVVGDEPQKAAGGLFGFGGVGGGSPYDPSPPWRSPIDNPWEARRIKDGSYVKYYKTGKKWFERHYKNGKVVLDTVWYENGKKGLEEHFKNGELDGLFTAWWENGKKRIECHYQNGKLVSASVWKPDGDPCPITKVVDGSGIVVLYRENGKKWRESHYKNGKMVLETHRDENGQKWDRHYKNGKVMLETHWDESGRKRWEIHYKNGEQVSRKEF